MRKKWIRGLAAAAVSLFAAFGIPEAVLAAEPETALEGIYVENISVGGMTEEEITQAVNAKVEELKNSTIQLNGGKPVDPGHSRGPGTDLYEYGHCLPGTVCGTERKCPGTVPCTAPSGRDRAGGSGTAVFRGCGGSAQCD